MDEVYQLPQPVRAQLAAFRFDETERHDIEKILENEYWRGYMDGEHDMNHRDRGIQIGGHSSE